MIIKGTRIPIGGVKVLSRRSRNIRASKINAGIIRCTKIGTKTELSVTLIVTVHLSQNTDAGNFYPIYLLDLCENLLHFYYNQLILQCSSFTGISLSLFFNLQHVSRSPLNCYTVLTSMPIGGIKNNFALYKIIPVNKQTTVQ